MSSPDARPVLHPERTADPAVVRWVVHEPALPLRVVTALMPPADSLLGSLLREGRLASLTVDHECVRAQVADADDWAVLVQVVHEELVAALAARAEWLLAAGDEPAGHDAAGVPPLEVVRRVVADATASLTALHGGGIDVVAVDAHSVTLHLEGTCHGCSFSDETVRRLVAPALQRTFPTLTTIRQS